MKSSLGKVGFKVPFDVPSQIELDLEPWRKSGITESLLRDIEKVEKLSHYQIIDHKLYRNDDQMFPFRNSGVEHFLLKIIDKLPDTEFYLNTRDWPQTSTWNPKLKLPIFSFSKVVMDCFERNSFWTVVSDRV